jgi:hypothetical protein
MCGQCFQSQKIALQSAPKHMLIIFPHTVETASTVFGHCPTTANSHLLRYSLVQRGLQLHFSTCQVSTVQDKDEARQVNRSETARWEMSKLLQCRSSEFVMVQGLANFPLLISQGPSLVWRTTVSATRCWILTKSLHKMQDMPICQHAHPWN